MTGLGRTIWPHIGIDAAGLAACIVLSGIFYVGGVRPRAARAAALEHQREQLVSQRQTAAQHQALLERLESQLAEIEAHKAKGGVELQSHSQLNQRVAELNEVMLSLNLLVEQVEPGTTARMSHYDAVELRLSGKGKYAQLGRFLRQLRQKFPDMAVAGLRWATDGGFELGLTWFTKPASDNKTAMAGQP